MSPPFGLELESALAFNLSLIMRKLTGVGTPRQAAARFWTCFNALVALLSAMTGSLLRKIRGAR